MPTRYFSDTALVNRIQSSCIKGGSEDTLKNSSFKRYSTGELGNCKVVSSNSGSSSTKKSVRFFGTVRVTLVAQTEELLPFAKMIWYSSDDYRNFKGQYKCFIH